MPTLTVIAPVYEEAPSIRMFHDALRQVLDSIRDRYEAKIVYVCDPGRDASEDRLREIAKADERASVIVFSRRFGHQAALLAGLDFAKSDVVIMMDSDMQHPPAVIPALLDAYEKGFDIVHTVRTYGPEIGWLKRLTSRLYYHVLQSLADTRIRENSADFRLVSGRVAALFQSSIRERNQFLRGLISWVGFKQTEVHFDAPARAAGTTKYSASRMLAFAVAGITSFSKKPLRYSIYVGFVTAVFGLLLAAWTILEWLVGKNFPAGWATLLSLTALLGGVQLVFLGVVGEYIASIFDEVKARPSYIIDYTLNESTPAP